jgi:hypothetical protein
MSHRLQATLSDPVMEQVRRLEAELRLDTSEIVAEAISLLAKTVFETKRGARLGFKRNDEPMVREYSSPALTRLEWSVHEQEPILLSDADYDRVAATVDAPPEPTPALRALSRRRRSGKR